MVEETENGSVGRYGMATIDPKSRFDDALDAASGPVSVPAISPQDGSVHAVECTEYDVCACVDHPPFP